MTTFFDLPLDLVRLIGTFAFATRYKKPALRVYVPAFPRQYVTDSGAMGSGWDYAPDF